VSVTIPLWVFLLIPFGVGLYLIYSDKGTGGYMLSLPTMRTWFGCGMLLVWIGVLAGLGIHWLLK
jgi:hypothetical protein